MKNLLEAQLKEWQQICLQNRNGAKAVIVKVKSEFPRSWLEKFAGMEYQGRVIKLVEATRNIYPVKPGEILGVVVK